MKPLKNSLFVILVFLFTSSFIFGQNDIWNVLKNTKWQTTYTAFEDYNRKEISILPIQKGENFRNSFIEFDSTNFISYYSPECRHDCFTTVKGEYVFIDDDVISVKVISIDRSYYCEAKSVTTTKNLGNYLIAKNLLGWTLTKL